MALMGGSDRRKNLFLQLFLNINTLIVPKHHMEIDPAKIQLDRI